jgi:hypothetical protein
MAIVNPTPPTTPPALPQRADRATFSSRVDAGFTWFQTAVTEVYGLAQNAVNNATEALNSASAASTSAGTATTQANLATAQAAAAAALTNALPHNPSTSYTLAQPAISNVNFLAYRRKSAGTSATDPSLDPTNWAATSSSANGGTLITGSVTLTSASAGAMSISPSSYGQGMTLPDATTCLKSSELFSAINTSDYDYFINDSTGTRLGFIRAKGFFAIGLADNATAAGKWVPRGLSHFGITAGFTNTTLTNSGAVKEIIDIDANRQFFLFGSTNLYGVIFDKSSNTWGSALTIRTGAGNTKYTAILSASNQILVASMNTTTGMELVTITLNGGVTMTLNSGTKLSFTHSTTVSTMGKLIAVGSSFVLSCSRGQSEIRAITISGTTPTIGNLTYQYGTVVCQMFATGSVVRTVTNNDNILSCVPYTVSGTTLTVGTEAQFSTGTFINLTRSFMNGNGNIVTQWFDTGTGAAYASIFKLTGTTEAISTVNMGSYGIAPTITYSEAVQISASKTCFFLSNSYIRILTDTAGTASVGTSLATTLASASGLCAVPTTANFADFIIQGTTYAHRISVDCTTTTPSISTQSTYATYPSSTYMGVQPSDANNKRDGRTFISNGSAIGLSAAYPSLNMLKNSFNVLPVAISMGSPKNDSNDNATWFNLDNSSGQVIRKIEVVL